MLVARATRDPDGLQSDGKLVLNSLPASHLVLPCQPNGHVTQGDIVVSHSTDVHVGHKSYFNGPVTMVLPDKAVPLSPAALNLDLKSNLDNVKVEERPKFLLRKKALILTAVCLLGVLVITGTVVAIFTQTSSPEPEAWRLVMRSEWNALAPRGKVKNLTISPALFVVISHSALKQCMTTTDCSREVQLIQEYQYNQNRPTLDIAYNFLVGGDGMAYEGRGWDKEGAHTRFQNNRSIGVNFIGKFMTVVPPQQQINALFHLLDIGLAANKLIPDYKIYFHKQFSATESPGAAFIQVIKTWKRWAPLPDK